MKNYILKTLIFSLFILFLASSLHALVIYPEDRKGHHKNEHDQRHHNDNRHHKHDHDWERHDRGWYDDYHHRMNCENRAENSCRYHKHKYKEYFNSSEYYWRIGKRHKANEYRRRAEHALRDYRHCLSRELNECRRRYRH